MWGRGFQRVFFVSFFVSFLLPFIPPYSIPPYSTLDTTQYDIACVVERKREK